MNYETNGLLHIFVEYRNKSRQKVSAALEPLVLAALVQYFMPRRGVVECLVFSLCLKRGSNSRKRKLIKINKEIEA